MSASKRLTEYGARRNFAKTNEPRPKGGQARRSTLGFFVQKHDARRLHYDLRLEWDGVLLSWAITKGPSPDPSQKRLAVRTEDHPLSYGDFEGTIPKKEYGGGTVMLWDKGTWEPREADPDRALAAGKLKFVAHGERMRAGWTLVRMRPRARERRENWLLIKEKDEEADDDPEALTAHYTTSIVSLRSMKQITTASATKKSAPRSRKRKKSATPKRRSSRRGKLPAFQKPQLATLSDDIPDGTGWVHESKFDGYRCLVAVGGGKSRCYTRTGLDWTDKFAEVAGALSALECDSALLDGEVVAVAGNGGSQFSALQAALSEGGPIEYFAFDLLHLDGRDLRKRPLTERKTELRQLLATLPRHAPVHYSEHVRGSGQEVFDAMCRKGMEGMLAKKAEAPYTGRRSRTWLKIKCKNRQEFVIGGYSPSDKRGRPFASLLLGTYEGIRFVYRGRVGTGFSESAMKKIADKLHGIRRKTSPFGSVPDSVSRGAIWVNPKLVAEIDFAEFTDEGHVRHGAFRGLRLDKTPVEVTMEKATETSKGTNTEIHGVRLTHPDRVLFQQQGVTKADLARYYGAVARRMLPMIAAHPLSLVRCPKGAGEKCFFQKHASDGFPEALKKVSIDERSGESADYLYVDDVAGLIAGVQMGTLEFHIWGSKVDLLEKPDRLVFDLDPDEHLDFEVVRLAATVVRDRLDDIGLQTLPLVTGGKGVHVVAPLRRTADWETIKSFAKSFAKATAEAHSDVFTATMSKSRRRGKIFIDWLRNERGATAVAPYSTRARKNAPVATPVGWKELRKLEAANSFGIDDVIRRMGRPDPWASYGQMRQSLTKEMQAAVA